MTANKFHYDLVDVHYAIATLGDDGQYTYGTPVAITGARSMECSAEGDSKTVRADGVDYIVTTDNQGYSVTLALTTVYDSLRKALLGEKSDTATGIQYEIAGGEPVHFALLGGFRGSADPIRWVMYDCTASRPGIKGENKDRQLDFDDESLEIKAHPTPITVGSDEVMVVRGGILKSANATTYANWLTSVQKPGQTTTTTPTGEGD